MSKVQANIACSQTIYFLFKVLWAPMIKYKLRGIYWPPVQGSSGGGKRKYIILSFLCSLLVHRNERRKVKKKNVCVNAKANNQRQLAVPVVKDYTYLWLGWPWWNGNSITNREHKNIVIARVLCTKWIETKIGDTFQVFAWKLKRVLTL